jgi:hypothetical protein
MSLIIFKDERDKDVAIVGHSVVSVEHLDDGVSLVCYRVADQIKSVNVKHPVLEVVSAVNKVSVTWL